MAENQSGEPILEQSEGAAASNLAVIGGGPGYYGNILMGNAASNQQNVNSIAMSLAGKVAESIIATSPGEGMSDVGIAMQLVKAGAITPPVTGSQ